MLETGTLIVSTGRCGSTLMSDLMNLHPDVLSLSEFFTVLGPGVWRLPDMDGPQLWELMCGGPPGYQELLRLAWSPEMLAEEGSDPDPLELIPIPHLARRHRVPEPMSVRRAFQTAVEAQPRAPVAEHFPAIFDAVRSRLARKCWVERSGGSLAYVAELLKAFPGARIICLHRDERATVLSMSKHPYFKLRAVHSQVGPMSVEQALAHDLSLGDFRRYLRRMVSEGLEALEQDGRPVLHVSYEGLTSKPRDTLPAVFAFMGLPCVDLDAACAIIR